MSKTGKSRLSRLLPKFLRGGDKKADGGIDSKSPFCFIHFLDDSDHQMQIKGNWKGGALQEKVCELLNLHEKDYFGLRFIDASGQTHWLDGAKSLSSQFKGCQTPHKLYFGVKFYAADPCKLREEITRYLFFLQVKQDILQGRLPVTFDEASELCAYAVQSELGDFDPRQHTEGYVSEFCFVPNQTEDLERRISSLHRRMGGLVPLMAEYRYLDKVKWLDMYGVDLHPVLGEGNVEYFLGLTPTGIVVYKNKNKVGNYFWPRISKVTFKGKIFIVKVKDKNNEEHVYAFELPRKTACKHLWKCCVEHHAFFRLNQTQERTSRENRVLRSVSSNRRSGRSERQAISDNLCKNSSSVNRLPSRRQPRRVSSDSRINAEEKYNSQYDGDTGMVTMMMRPQPVRAPRHRSLPELQGHESPRSTKSAPWETNFDYGLYTHGKESPVSERSNKAREQRNRQVTGSDSESGISHRRKYFPNRRGSDNDSDVSVTRRRRRDMDSDSASDVSSRYPASQGNERSKNAFPVLYPFHDKENRPNGSIPSLHSAPAGEAKQRRRRRRSKSPSKRPPDELKQHFEYELKNPDGLSTDELREIPFVNVETKASLFKLKYSPKLRQKVKAAKQKSLADVDQNRNQLTRKQNSLPLQDEIERDMSVRSQPLPWKSSGDRHAVSSNHSMVDHSRVPRQPLSLHQPQTQTPYSDSHPPPRVPARPHSQLYHSAPKHTDSETDSRAKPRSDAGDNYTRFRSDTSDHYAMLRPDASDNYSKLRSDANDNYAKPRRDTSDNYAKPRPDPSDTYSKLGPDSKATPSKVPSDLLYQPSQAPRVQRHPQEQYDLVKQREGHAAPQSSRSSHVNHVPRISRPPSDNDTQLKSANGSSVTPQYSRSPNENAAPRPAIRSPPKHAHCRSSDVESNQPQHVSSTSSCRSSRSHHRHSLSRNHPHLQGAYDSDVSSSIQRPRDHQNEASRANPSRYSSRYSREQEDFAYSDDVRAEMEYERLHPQHGVDTWREGSRSGQRGEGWMSSGYQYREDSPQQAHSMGPPPTSQGPPSGYEGRHHGNNNVSYSSMSSPPQSYHQYHQHQHQHPPPPPSTMSTYPNQSYPYGSHSHTSPPANAHYDQGQRPRSYGQEEGSRLMPPPYSDDRLREEQERSRLYGGEEGQQGRYQGEGDRSRASFRDVRPRPPRNQYEGEGGQQQYDYHRKAGFAQGPPYHPSPQPYRQPSPQPYRQPSPQPPNHSLPTRTQGTPPRHQGTPPRHQGTPPRYQGTPPRYQGTPSKQSVSGTPPRQSVDPRYSQGHLSVHAREHSEGSSSQASARGGPGGFHRAPHHAQHAQGALGSTRSDPRNVGNSLTPEQARQLLKSSNYNPDLCTEL